MGKGLVQFNAQAPGTRTFFPICQSLRASCLPWPSACRISPGGHENAVSTSGYSPRQKQGMGKALPPYASLHKTVCSMRPQKSSLRHSVFHRHPQEAVFAGNGGPLV